MRILILLLLCCSCRKWIDAGPPTNNLVDDNIYNNDASATGALNGIYTTLSQPGFATGEFSIAYLTGLSADEFYPINQDSSLLPVYQNRMTAVYVPFWSGIYSMIGTTNTAIEKLSTSSGLTPIVRQHLLGEAKFLRAFGYYYLVNIFGDIPLITGTDFKKNKAAARTPAKQVYDQILYDLCAADTLLSPEFMDADLINTSTERVRPSHWAALALIARVSLILKDYKTALTAANAIIDQNNLFSLTTLDQVFRKNSQETIWQLQPVLAPYTEDGHLFLGTQPVALSPILLTAFSGKDQRLDQWVTSAQINNTTYYFPYKYKSWQSKDPIAEYLTVLRFAEIYLIRSEAKLALGNIEGAQNDLNKIVVRAGLPPFKDTNPEDLQLAILHERQLELFSEWGHRWLDLHHSGTLDEAMAAATAQKGSSWQSFRQWYPIPSNDLLNNPNLTQNAGY